ncbi:class I lanthipeptide [Flavobacterium foetidum]|uniref:class I lanthipeptide n=1 Tax=Flavobacterium foetidum TaxID=2026681 RepID=UPI0010758A7E|nr:class I lanthipeptide [Flavobacterium foetidum]KAF2510588.1 hypothetical protein E0W73_17865 [Flavobacterium foetidum]
MKKIKQNKKTLKLDKKLITNLSADQMEMIKGGKQQDQPQITVTVDLTDTGGSLLCTVSM